MTPKEIENMAKEIFINNLNFEKPLFFLETANRSIDAARIFDKAFKEKLESVEVSFNHTERLRD